MKASTIALGLSSVLVTSIFLACSSDDPTAPAGAVTVTAVSPDHGSARGGDSITIVGTGFGASPTVRFGAGQATVQSATDTQIVALAPHATAGAVDVEVDVGSSSGKLGASFTYEALPLSFVDVTWRNLDAYLVGGAGSAVGDANGDGALDVFQAAGNEGVWVYTNDKSGNFDAPRLLSLPTVLPTPSGTETPKPVPTDAQSIAAADFDRDGKLDLYIGTGSGTPNVLLLGDGKGGFVPSKTVLPPLVGTKETLAVGDLDGDGDPDLVLVGVGAAAKDPPQIAILANDQGTFTDITKKLAGGSFAATGVAIGDVDKDGDLDLFFGADTDTSRLYVNDGKATFQHASPDALPTDALHAGVPAMGDLDGNGTLDLYVPSSGQDHYLSNDGTGIFSDLSTLRLGQENAGGATASLVDFDLDGRLDVAVLDRTGDLRLYRNDASNRLFDYTDQVVGSAAGVVNAGFAVGDLDGDGDEDIFLSRTDLSPAGLLLNTAPISSTDTDGDGVPDAVDDCPDVEDPSQDNLDSLPMHCYSGSSCKQGTGCTLYAHEGSTYLVCPDAQTWAGAEARCRLFDAHLASIETAEESTYVGSIAGSEALMGYSTTAVGGKWTWTDGSTSSYVNWAGGATDGTGTCSRILPNGTWDDVACGDKRAYVCESARFKAPDPGDACDPCPSNYDPAQKPIVGGVDAGASDDLGVDAGADAGAAPVCKSAG